MGMTGVMTMGSPIPTMVLTMGSATAIAVPVLVAFGIAAFGISWTMFFRPRPPAARLVHAQAH